MRLKGLSVSFFNNDNKNIIFDIVIDNFFSSLPLIDMKAL